MTVTKSSIKTQLDATLVEQQRGQSWLVKDSKFYNARLFVSYETVVGIEIGSVWYFTTERFSVSTARQLSCFVKTLHDARVVRINPYDFGQLLKAARV